MTILKFTDGMKFDLSGSLRKELREDGWYIIGEGRLHAEIDEEAADKFLSEHSKSQDKKSRVRRHSPLN
jgi:hypothetical protein